MAVSSRTAQTCSPVYMDFSLYIRLLTLIGFYFAVFFLLTFTFQVLQYGSLWIFGPKLNFCLSNRIGLTSAARPNAVIFRLIDNYLVNRPTELG